MVLKPWNMDSSLSRLFATGGRPLDDAVHEGISGRVRVDPTFGEVGGQAALTVRKEHGGALL